MSNINSTVVFGYVGCNGKEFFSAECVPAEKKLYEVAEKLNFTISFIQRVEQQSYRQYALRDVQGLIMKAIAHRVQNPQDRILFCFDNLRLVLSYLPEQLIADVLQFLSLVDTYQLERDALDFEAAKLYAGVK